MSLIDTVARLKELAANDIPGTYSTNCPEYEYAVGVLNATPMLLDVLGEIRVGDAEKMQSFIDAWECIYGKIEVLHRYRDIAARMEATK